MKRFLFLMLGGILVFCLSGITFGNTYPGSEAELPYVGVIINKTKYDVSVPSLNSGATLIVPAEGWIEYVVWSTEFEVIGYFCGSPLCCQKVKVNPKSYQFMCKAYDFSAEICPAEKPAKKSKPVRKKRKRFWRKKPKPIEVEGLG